VVSTAPLIRTNQHDVGHVIEMCLDVTEARALEQELLRANILRRALVENSLDAIVVLDARQRIALMNRAAEELWGISRQRGVGRRVPKRMIPPALADLAAGRSDAIHLVDTTIVNMANEEIPVRLAGVSLTDGAHPIGVAVIVQDLREIKRLEHDKLEAERLAAVGQTVAGLAHGIKNILTGLEGGMYVTATGLKKDDHERIERGFGMLQRNMGRISSLARDLLAFSRGDAPQPARVDPATIVHEVVDLYRENAERQGIELRTDIQPDIAPASLDADGIHTCLANLISNAVDACQVSESEELVIRVRLEERDDTLVLEVSDTGCGMDYEVKQKVFTSFFTTKGTGGSGIGLLTTRKIVQQHGGAIDFESTPGRGATFRLRFRRDRLPEPVEESS
jgi:PAS domain S-box-containing protein